MPDYNLTNDIEELIAEVIEDKEERDLYLKLVPKLEQDELEELAEMLERQASEKEAMIKKQQLELAQMASEFDEDWDSAEGEAETMKAKDAVEKAPEMPTVTPTPVAETPAPTIAPTPIPAQPAQSAPTNPFADLGN